MGKSWSRESVETVLKLESLAINKYEQSFYDEYVNLFVATNITGERSVTIQRKLCPDS